MNRLSKVRSRNVWRRQQQQLTGFLQTLPRLFSGSSSSSPGTVVGVWVFARHGDRTPAKPLMADNVLEEEASFWRTKLPTPEPLSAFKTLSEVYPPSIHASNEKTFLDVKRLPYGFLTRKGVQQMKHIGKRFFARYSNSNSLHSTDMVGSSLATDASESFLDSWNVKAFSTNYLRTVLSLQSFLDGLLGTDCYDPSKFTSSLDEPLLIPNHDALLENKVAELDFHDTINVHVRGRHQDTLNAFDRNPEEMMKLVATVVDSAEFQTKDAEAVPLASRLALHLPGLARKGAKLFGGPSGINWIEASDHFVCRESHQVKFSRFLSEEGDDRAEHILQAMSYQTLAHLAWRYRQWYKNIPLLAAIAAPPLREVLVQMQATPTMNPDHPRPFFVYSCHDVTILALLYGIGAEFLADELKGEWRFWPSYGTTLVFELIRIGEDASQESHAIRIRLNDKPIFVVDLLKYQQSETEARGAQSLGPEPVGSGPARMLRIQDLNAIISRLEEAGDFDQDKFGYDDTDTERDMSNWTG